MSLASRITLACLSLLAALLISGCASVAPGHERLVVNAERVQVTAFETVDSFLAVEHSRREHFSEVAPGLHAAAEYMRRVAPRALNALHEATIRYKLTRTDTDKTALTAALAVVEQLALEASRLSAEARELK